MNSNMESIKKIKVAFIYKKSNNFLTGNHFDNTYFHFFMEELRKDERIIVTDFPTNEIFDASILKNNFDIILLWNNHGKGMPNEILGIQDLTIPVISNNSDFVWAKKAIKNHKKWKIDHYFDFVTKEMFYSAYPKNFKFKTIIYGLDPSLYENVKPFQERIKNKILLTGATGNTKFFSKIINDIRNPKWNAFRFYHLRTMCSKLSYVDYTTTLQHKYVNDQYPKLLEQYSASIVASSYSPNIKYWENAAAGCLTFMEITKKNRGEYVGYIDGETCIFINEDNYQEKFKEYLNDINNPKWGKIAAAGREFTLNNLNNKKAVKDLIEIMNLYV
jgi:hypothetical protein